MAAVVRAGQTSVGFWFLSCTFVFQSAADPGLTFFKSPNIAKPCSLADIFMEHYYTLIFILAIAFGLSWHYLRLKRISARQITSDYCLKQIQFSLSWTQFILPTIFLIIGLYGEVSVFIVSLGTTLFISVIVEWILTRNFVYDAYVISGNNIIRNGLKIKEFNLQELTIIDFLPFSDSLKLKFKDGQSLSIHRPNFQTDSLIIFLKVAIEKSKFYVAISDDAKSKIYIEETTSR